MSRLSWNVTAYPLSEIYAVCDECKKEIVRKKYDGYIDYKYWRDKLKKQYPQCPQCANHKCAPTWEKQPNGDYLSKCVGGDFLIWKYGNAYKWRYRDYGRESANYIGFASTLKIAKKMCEKQKQWTVV